MSTVNVGNSTSNPVPVNVNAALPAGSNTLGNVNIQANGTAISFGQAVMASSLPVVVASNQSNLPTNITQISGSAIATAATGIMKVGLTDGTGTAITSTSNAIDVNIKSGGGSGFSAVDEVAWTAGTSAFAPTGGVFNDSATALTSGQEGTLRLTNNRAVHSNIRNAAGTELATSSNPLRTDPTGTTTQPVSIASLPALPANQSVNVAQINGVTPLMGNGTSGTGSQRVTIASDSTGQIALATGSNMIGVSSPGGTTATAIAAAATNTIVKASAGRLCRVLVTAAGTAALTFYDNATGGATTGNILGYIPANAGAGSVYDFQFIASTGIQAPGGANTPAVTVGYI